MKLAFFEIEPWAQEGLKTVFPKDELFFSPDKLDALSLPAELDFDIISVQTTSRLTKEVLANFPNLKCIVTRSTGYDHIDLAEAKARGIQVGYVPGYGDVTVAEFAFGLILSITRNIYRGADAVKEYGSFDLTGLRGTDINGKTIGVIGTGRIGKNVIKIAQGFGMKVIAFDPFPDTAFAAAQQIAYVSLDELLAASDVITIHCPATPQTFHLLNKDNMPRIKKGAYVVNTARGTIIETQALIDALESGQLRGAALDVLEAESSLMDEAEVLMHGHPDGAEMHMMLLGHALMKMPNVIITPHMAFDSDEAVRRILACTVENIRGFESGELPHPVPQK